MVVEQLMKVVIVVVGSTKKGETYIMKKLIKPMKKK